MNVSVCEMYVCYCWVSEFVRVLSCPRSVATYSSVVVSSDTAAGYARTVRVYCTWCTYVEAWVTMTKDGTHIHITVYCHAGDSATVVDESSNMLFCCLLFVVVSMLAPCRRRSWSSYASPYWLLLWYRQSAATWACCESPTRGERFYTHTVPFM